MLEKIGKIFFFLFFGYLFYRLILATPLIWEHYFGNPLGLYYPAVVANVL